MLLHVHIHVHVPLLFHTGLKPKLGNDTCTLHVPHNKRSIQHPNYIQQNMDAERQLDFSTAHIYMYRADETNFSQQQLHCTCTCVPKANYNIQHQLPLEPGELMQVFDIII